MMGIKLIYSFILLGTSSALAPGRNPLRHLAVQKGNTPLPAPLPAAAVTDEAVVPSNSRSYSYSSTIAQPRQSMQRVVQPSMIKSRQRVVQPSMIQNQVGQMNTNIGWIYMASYWTIGAIVSVALGYTPSSWNPIASPFTRLHAVSMAITLGVTKMFTDNMTNFGRPKSWRSILASFIKAASNGTIETILMLVAFDLGAVWLNRIISISAAGTLTIKAAALGFLTFFCYSGLIHAFFWLPKALPPHIRPGGRPFHVRGLPLLSLLSVSWLAMYVFTKDIAFVCVLHFLFNFYGAMVMGLQLPSFWNKK
jgi:hypothetical protein